MATLLNAKQLNDLMNDPDLKSLISFKDLTNLGFTGSPNPPAITPNAPGVNANADTTIGLNSANTDYVKPPIPFTAPKSTEGGNSDILTQSQFPNLSLAGGNAPVATPVANPLEYLGGLAGAGVQGVSDIVGGGLNAIGKGFTNSTPGTSKFITDFLDNLSANGIVPTEDQIIKALSLNPYKGQQENITLDTLLQNRSRSEIAKAKLKEDNQYKIDTGRLDPKSPEFKEFNTLVDTKAQLGYLLPQINKAIERNDANAISLIGNQIAALASVANKQGVVNGEEVNRVLGSIQAATQQINAGQWTPQNTVKLGRELWSGLNRFGEIVNGGTDAKLQRYQDTYIIPESFFQRSGINIHNTPESITNPTITPEEQDKAIARATNFDTVKRATSTGAALAPAMLGFIDGVAKSVGLDTNFSKNYNPKTDNPKIDDIITKYYQNEDKLYNDKVFMKKAGDLIDSGDVEGLKALLGAKDLNSAPAQAPAAPRAGSKSGWTASDQGQLDRLNALANPGATAIANIKALEDKKRKAGK